VKLAEFYLIVNPGLEALAAQELRLWIPHSHPKEEFGGVSVTLPLDQGLSLNSCLKIPTRILLRVTQFRCRDFPKLFQKISQFPWQDWMNPKLQVQIHVSSSKSRLNIKKRIQSTVEEAFQKFQKRRNENPIDDKMGVYVRFHENICTLSLDTSGERLHKRSGEGKHIGVAPLRETLAAAMIYTLLDGLKGKFELVDPMMGSGTFFNEALLLHEVLMKSNSAVKFNISDLASLNPPESHHHWQKFLGYEYDEATLKVAEHNLKGREDLASMDLLVSDVFELSALSAPTVDRLVICNPPYGERIKISGSIKFYYERLFLQIEQCFSPRRACFMLPTNKIKGRLSLPKNWLILKKLKTTNGGLSVTIYLFENLENIKNS